MLRTSTKNTKGTKKFSHGLVADRIIPDILHVFFAALEIILFQTASGHSVKEKVSIRQEKSRTADLSGF